MMIVCRGDRREGDLEMRLICQQAKSRYAIQPKASWHGYRIYNLATNTVAPNSYADIITAKRVLAEMRKTEVSR
jgi:hypothetical protein